MKERFFAIIPCPSPTRCAGDGAEREYIGNQPPHEALRSQCSSSPIPTQSIVAEAGGTVGRDHDSFQGIGLRN